MLFLNSSTKAVNNLWAAVYANENADLGDWSYFDEGSWVTAWSIMLNVNVRKGDMTFPALFNQKVAQANKAIKNQNLKVYRI